MKKHFWTLCVFVLFVSMTLLGFKVVPRALGVPFLKHAFHKICDRVEQEYFEESEDLKKWGLRCHQRAEGLNPETKLPESLAIIQQELSRMHISHLEIWDPLANDYFFSGISKDTGLRLKNIEGHPLVHSVLPRSAAEEAGFRKGDEILEINGQEIREIQEGEGPGGTYHVLRGEAQLVLDLAPTQYTQNLEPQVNWLPRKVAVFRIPRFNPEYEGQSSHWKQLAQEMKSARTIIIDLRENTGGDFQTMLRALSPFFCEPTEIGMLRRDRNTSNFEIEAGEFESIDEFAQELTQASSLILRTFQNYPCLNQTVRVLVDTSTASVAEVFAHAFLRRPKASVWGEISSGSVVSAMIYPTAFGGAYTLHVPYSAYEASDGVRLEGRGVWPERKLTYRLADELAGLDSWYLQASKDN